MDSHGPAAIHVHAWGHEAPRPATPQRRPHDTHVRHRRPGERARSSWRGVKSFLVFRLFCCCCCCCCCCFCFCFVLFVGVIIFVWFGAMYPRADIPILLRPSLPRRAYAGAARPRRGGRARRAGDGRLHGQLRRVGQHGRHLAGDYFIISVVLQTNNECYDA